MTRSASRWSYETCHAFESLRTPTELIWDGYLGEDDDYMDACLAHALKAEQNAVVVSSHSLSKRLVRMVLNGLAKNVYTYRDPRDSIASIMRIASDEYEAAFTKVYTSLLLFDLFSGDKYSLLLAYSDIMDDAIGMTAKISKYLDFGLTDEEIRAVHLNTQKLAIERRNEQRRRMAHSTLDAEKIDAGFESMKGEATSAPKIDNPWRYSALNEDQYAEATHRLRPWLLKMNFSLSPIPPWRPG